MYKFLSYANAGAAVALALASCHSHKIINSAESANIDVQASASAAYAANQQMQWLSQLSLDIDSFELVMPNYQFDNSGKIILESAISLRQFDTDPGQPRYGSVALRAKHARLGKADVMTSNENRCSSSKDSLTEHRSIDKIEQQDRNSTAVTKPPDMTWLPYVALACIIAIILFTFHHKKRSQ